MQAPLAGFWGMAVAFFVALPILHFARGAALQLFLWWSAANRSLRFAGGAALQTAGSAGTSGACEPRGAAYALAVDRCAAKMQSSCLLVCLCSLAARQHALAYVSPCLQRKHYLELHSACELLPSARHRNGRRSSGL